jgi:hypothetical protein
MFLSMLERELEIEGIANTAETGRCEGALVSYENSGFTLTSSFVNAPMRSMPLEKRSNSSGVMVAGI